MNYLRWIAAWTLVSACGACGGSAATAAPTTPTTPVDVRPISAPVHKRGSDKLIAEIGSAGGTLELESGARLDIPAGALSEMVEVTFAAGSRTTAFSNHDYERPVGPTLEIAPEASLEAPIEVSIPSAKIPDGFEEQDLALGVEVPATKQRAIEGQSVQTRWDYNPASARNGRAVASLSQLFGYRVQFVVSKGD